MAKSAVPCVIGLIVAILFTVSLCSLNQRSPSGPVVISSGCEFAVGALTSLNATVFGLMTPTLSVPDSVNHRLPSGPVVIPLGCESAVGSVVASVKAGVVGLNIPILLPACSVNQRLPSGPVVMSYG